MKISEYAIDHPVPATVILALAVGFGAASIGGMSQAMFPDFTKPTIHVSLGYPGASPEQVDEAVTRVLEDELSKVPGILSMTSRSLPSASSVSLEFGWSTDVDEMMVEVRERLNAADLPDGVAGAPRIRKLNPSEMPVLTIGVESRGGLRHAASYVEGTVLPALSSISGIASADAVGMPEDELAVDLDLFALAARGLGPADVAQALKAASASVPLGAFSDAAGSLSATAKAEPSSPEEVEGVAIASKGGAAIRVGDVAEVSEREAAPERYALVNGERAILIDLTVQRGADTVAAIDAAKRVLSGLEREAGGSISFRFYRDQSSSIRASIRSVRDSAILGAVLAVVVLFAFLGDARATLIIALSIPFTVLVAFVALYLGGHSINLMTLGGMTVAVGMIVDASIVMLDNIWRHASLGLSPKEAARKGASEMGSAILASTLTSVVVFVPLAFVEGITGIVLRDVALTIIYALAGSVISAVLIVPLASSGLLGLRRGAPGSARPRSGLASAPAALLGRLERGYSKALGGALSRPGPVLALGASIVILSAALLSALGFEFIPEADSRELVVELDLPEGSTVEATRRAALAADASIAGAAPEAERRIFFVGQAGAWSATATVATHAYGVVALGEDGRSSFDLIPEIRRAIESSVPGVRVTVRNGGTSEKTAAAYGGSGFRVAVTAPSIGGALEGAEAIAAVLSSDPGVTGVRLSASRGVRYAETRIDQELAGSLGVSPLEAAQAAKIAINGAALGEFKTGTAAIVVRAGLDGMDLENAFDSVLIRSKSGRAVPLSAFTSTEVKGGVSEIPRVGGLPTVQVVAQLDAAGASKASGRLLALAGSAALPPGASWSKAGSAAESASSLRALALALLVGVVLVYAVMAIQFERYAQPLIVITSIPFVLVGSATALLAFGSSVSIISMLGMISLAGVAVNNAIIMVEYVNLLRSRDGLPLRQALIEGASSRVRPILMTTLTTILGVVPLAFAGGESRTIAALGQVILGGLSTSTVLTLFVVPCLYLLVEARKERRMASGAKGAPL